MMAQIRVNEGYKGSLAAPLDESRRTCVATPLRQYRACLRVFRALLRNDRADL